jgi:IS1 family transposase
MNQLPLPKRVQIINLLVEGNSLRATSRVTGCSINTVTKLLVEVGKACQTFHNETVVHLQTKRVECDEIWSFVYAKEKNLPEEKKTEVKSAGDVWTWTAIDADSKLMISWLVGDRGHETAEIFMSDVALRLANRVQLSADGHFVYLKTVDKVFGAAVDFAQITKIYGNEVVKGQKRYSSPECIGSLKNVVTGNPERKHISTSYVERQNLTMRMHMRRFTRLTNAFSKKIENHCYAIALHFVYYNFIKVHKTLRVTPAMEAGIAKKPMSIDEVVLLTETIKTV